MNERMSAYSQNKYEIMCQNQRLRAVEVKGLGPRERLSAQPMSNCDIDSDDFQSFADCDIYIDKAATPYIEKYPLISEIIGTARDKDPGFMFEDIAQLDQALLAKHEKGIVFNKDYLIEFWDEMESLDLKKHWDNRYNKSNLKCWTSKNGTKFDKSNICIRVEAIYDKMYPFEALVQAITDVTMRKQWDSNLAKSEQLFKLARNA